MPGPLAYLYVTVILMVAAGIIIAGYMNIPRIWRVIFPPHPLAGIRKSVTALTYYVEHLKAVKEMHPTLTESDAHCKLRVLYPAFVELCDRVEKKIDKQRELGEISGEDAQIMIDEIDLWRANFNYLGTRVLVIVVA